LIRAWNAVAMGEGVFQVEFRMRRHDGAYLWFDTRAVPVRDESGRLVKWFGSNTDISEQRKIQQQIQQLNAELEQRVRDRTVQLEVANRELESFSYSVSHDLRGPLRGIDGWSLALVEEYRDKLDEQARDYLDYIRSDAQRMGQLIDDMLRLSQVSRGHMERAFVDMGAVSQAVLARLQERQPDRRVEFAAQPGLAVWGDAGLLEIALTNLMDNALKFSSTRPVARIEFGRTEVDGHPVFFFRDNGVGFDMTYVHKLFGAFQRLHKASEFPGTGIGLAIVQRVVHRHGGRVWAKAEPGGGATFYFTLQEVL
jgi:light-regulated signal transduction histidine kinase (bacteriophytochrome)